MARPVASVVIPLYNNAALTQACLEAIVASTPEHLYEVVLVDNASTDSTGDLLDTLDGDVTIIRNPVNKAVTAAAMLVRPEAFAEAGGFDEGYWNGNEDIDLCLTMAAAGWATVYQPASRIVHHESVSGPERWSRCTDNMDRFRRRWYGRI